MNRLSILLLAITSVDVYSTSLRKVGVEENVLKSKSNRHLLPQSTCTLYRKCASYVPTDDHPSGHHKESWSCKLEAGLSTRNIESDYFDIVETPETSGLLKSAISGESTLTFNEAVILADESKMILPENSGVEVQNNILSNKFEARQTNKPPTSGTMSFLMIRVIDTNNVEPISTADELHEEIFGDGLTFKTQVNDCSFGQFQVEPFSGETPNKNVYVEKGFVDVKVDDFEVSLEDFPSKARAAANAQLGNLDDPRINLVLYCFPPGLTNKASAWAFGNNKYSFYSSKWCSSIGAIMHEVGHNIGLGHSGEVDANDSQKTYGDGTGAMGTNPGKDPVRLCYNAQKSYQLGWYADQTDSLYPAEGGKYSYTLNGVTDYRKNKDALLVLRLEQKSVVQDFYVGFNPPVGSTADISEGKNKVTIILKETGNPQEYSQSWKVGSLIPGQRHVINNFDDGRSIQVRFIGLKNGDAQIEVIGNDSEPTPITNKCKTFTIEFTTDSHPDLNAWYIADSNGKAVAASPKYTEAETKYPHEVCLPLGSAGETYIFTALDEKQENTCSYRILNDLGETIVSEDGSEKFEVREHFINVSPSCMDDKNYLFNGKPGKNCEWIATKKPQRCAWNAVSEACPVACKKCSEDCKDDPEFLFKDKQGKDCGWVAQKIINKPGTCNRKVSRTDDKRVKDFCPKTCSQCSITSSTWLV